MRRAQPRGRTTSSSRKSPDEAESEASIASAPTLDSGVEQPVASGTSRRGASPSGAPKQEVASVGMRLGRYELTNELGEGGMASVFEARDTKLGRKVAVKIMFPHLARRQEAVARFKREARAAAGLDHDHILRVFDVGGGEVEEGHLVPPYIVLELIDGQSLSEFFQGRESPLAEVVAAIGVALCRALVQAHEQSIVHRDIKPANVMVTQQGRLALADFGVAHIGDEDSVVTRTGAILGTPAYMSPEQATSEPVDARSDIYSLGATLYSIATGELPYSGTSAQILAAILEGKRSSVEKRKPEMGRELSRVIDQMMHTDASQRTSSAAEAESALLAIVQGGGFDDPEALLVDYFTQPEANQVRRATALSANLVRARNMAEEGRVPMALSLAERVLCLDRDNLQAQTLASKYGRQRGQRLWPAILLPMFITGFVGLVFWGSQPGSVAEYITMEDAAPRVVPTTTDSGVTITGAADANELAVGADSDAAPPPIKPSADRPNRKSRADAGPVQTKADASTPAAVLPPPPAEPASLIVDIKPWCDVWIDGKEVGRASPSQTYSVNAGGHEVECKQPGTGLRWHKKITLAAGETRHLRGTVLGEISVTLRLGKAESVRIAGRVVQNGATITIPAGRHRTEILREGQPTGKPQYLDLRQDCTLRDQPKLACFAR